MTAVTVSDRGMGGPLRGFAARESSRSVNPVGAIGVVRTGGRPSLRDANPVTGRLRGVPYTYVAARKTTVS